MTGFPAPNPSRCPKCGGDMNEHGPCPWPDCGHDPEDD